MELYRLSYHQHPTKRVLRSKHTLSKSWSHTEAHFLRQPHVSDEKSGVAVPCGGDQQGNTEKTSTGEDGRGPTWPSPARDSTVSGPARLKDLGISGLWAKMEWSNMINLGTSWMRSFWETSRVLGQAEAGATHDPSPDPPEQATGPNQQNRINCTFRWINGWWTTNRTHPHGQHMDFQPVEKTPQELQPAEFRHKVHQELLFLVNGFLRCPGSRSVKAPGGSCANKVV